MNLLAIFAAVFAALAVASAVLWRGTRPPVSFWRRLAPVLQQKKDEAGGEETWTEEHTGDLLWILQRGASLTRALGLEVLARGLAQSSQVAETQTALKTAGISGVMSLEEAVAGQIGLGVGAVLAWLALSTLGLLSLRGMVCALQCVTLGLCPLFWGVGYLLGDWLLRDRAAQRRNEIRRALPDATDLLIIGLESGMPFADALEIYAQHFHNPLADEFRAAERDLTIGHTREEALLRMVDRARVDELEALVNVVVQAEKFGVPVAQVLRDQRGQLRVQREQWVREITLAAPVKIALITTVLMLPAMLCPVLFPVAVNFMSFRVR